MEHRGLIIDHVFPGPAQLAGIKKGDCILRVNSQAVHDELDYRFFTSEECVEIDILRPETGQQWKKFFSGFQNIGLAFVPFKPMQCNNRCIFCFIDQLPRGMRSSLYFKDEDYRLSFLSGNFLTFSTVPDHVLHRICTMKLSPLYVSVHSTDPGVRNKMLVRKDSRDILEIIRILTSAGITLHTQVVLCPGINDGEPLYHTIQDLLEFYPRVASLAVVPVGLTQYRRTNRLYPLRPVTREYSLTIINEISEIQDNCKVKYDDYFVFLSDEFYIKANRRFPTYTAYGDFPQIENGVGMIPRFIHAWREKKQAHRSRLLRTRPIIVVTGKLAYPYIAPYVKSLIELNGLNVRLLAIPNRFFGSRITVTGLLTSKDLEHSLRSVIKPANVLLVPDVMLKEDEDVFLDNVSLGELGETLHIEVEKFAPNPEEFEKILYKTA
jgi:putative radical SAM enzyme (TIGR03279 family)